MELILILITFLISLDVVTLFTNILVELALNNVKKRWDYISKKIKIPLEEFLTSIRLVFNSIYIFSIIKFINKFSVPRWVNHCRQLLQT